MGKRVEANGVNTWYDERGRGDTVVLLHGGLTADVTMSKS